MQLGPVEIASIEEWEPRPGSVISWIPTPATLASAQAAPISDVPASYVQARHLHGLIRQRGRGTEHSRLFIAACQLPGRCDIRAMTYVINAHLKRHGTYRSWFEYGDDGQIVRRTMADPGDIEFAPMRRGTMAAAQIRDHVVSTPDSLHWDCFRFGVIQEAGEFTFWASVDHLHVDGQFVGVGLLEFQSMYTALAAGGAPVSLAPPGNYDEYCLRQREFTSALTMETPEVQAWISFAEKNNGTFPAFPLPLEEGSAYAAGDLISVKLMDEKLTQQFEDVCVAAGARFIGGLFAAAGHALHDLAGIDTYYGLTPVDTRRVPEDLATQGWFTGLIPVTVPVSDTSFGASARAAQECFDSGKALAQIPFERIVELVPAMKPPQPLFPMINFFDGSSGPLAPLMTSLAGKVRIATYTDGRVTYPLSTLVGRFGETFVTVVFPKSPVARESVARYVAALQAVCARAAMTGATTPFE